MKRLFIILACVLLHFSPAVAMPRTPAPPIGYSLFCMNHPTQCRPAKAAVLPHDVRTMRLLNLINREVNAAIRPVFEKVENWALSPAAGDCEDYALTKRARLIAAGLPPGALRMATVVTAKGENHAVLIVKTTSGDFVLDNLRRQIVRRQVAGYHHWRIASEDPRRWR